ncbi:MAG: transglycosylase SLT domain-containing protein [Candidatus Omnitrophica bacterium]|nr:transglycosylase SLT domain-containing protein [Candidatus Omnitrophota bacterium]
MSEKSNVDTWLERETGHKRKALENASRYFDRNDNLTVNTLEAMYGQESSFGTLLGERGAKGAAGHFQLEKATAERYGLIVSKKNDQRFDIDYASSAAARYLKDLDTMFSKKAILSKGVATIPVKSKAERTKLALAAYNGGEGRIALAQYLAQKAGKDPQIWNDVAKFLEGARATKVKAEEIRRYIEDIFAYVIEFAKKSAADKNVKDKEGKKPGYSCTEGHWVTIDDRPVFICD